MIRSQVLFRGIISGLIVLSGCTGTRPEFQSQLEKRLGNCPTRPNCVSSEAVDASHYIEPFSLNSEPDVAWSALQQVMADLPRTTIVTSTPDYLHAENRSRIWRFVDDVEFMLKPLKGTIMVRSASRLGYSDMGVNRRRIESIRETLIKRGVVK